MAAEHEYNNDDQVTTPTTFTAMQHLRPQPLPPPPTGPVLQRLIWHALHLCNVLLSQLGAYLSLEALHRDTCADGLIVPTPHLPLLVAQAVMMADIMKNLNAAAETLVRLPTHEEMMVQGNYHSLLDTARMMGMAVGK